MNHTADDKDKTKKPSRTHSIRNQIAGLFIVLFLLTLLAITLINGLFLEQYYISRKANVLEEAVESLESLDTREELYEENGQREEVEVPADLLRRSSGNNLSWVIISRDNQRIAHVGDNKSMLQERLFGYVYLDVQNTGVHILDQLDNYVVQQVYDRYAGMDYVEAWGSLSSGNFFLIRTPLESMEESAAISNTFYFFVGFFILLISGFFIWICTDRITAPIRELTRLSERMSNLEFSERYTSKAGNEIDILGDNFNRMSRQLELTISELKSANNKLKQDIADKIKIDEMRKEFLDNVSHELKTPIALISGYAEGLKENITDDPESMEFYCDVIMDESAKMNKLVQNLLTLNKLESNRDDVAMEHFDLVPLISGVLQSMEILIQQKNARVIFDKDRSVYVWADEFKTEEVITNYVSNALNHLEGENLIEIRILSEGERVKVTVFNTGQPIPEEDLPLVWNKFFKVDKARTREYGGSGIGLSIVKAIMESMDQDYGVQNYDNGVAFWFTLDQKAWNPEQKKGS